MQQELPELLKIQDLIFPRIFPRILFNFLTENSRAHGKTLLTIAKETRERNMNLRNQQKSVPFYARKVLNLQP